MLYEAITSYLFVYSFIRLFVYSFIRLFVYSGMLVLVLSEITYTQGCSCFTFDARDYQRTIFTPRNNPVTACISPEFVLYSPEWYEQDSIFNAHTGGNNNVWGDISNTYNCHGFAFHMQRYPDEPVKICASEAVNYINDGSYNLVTEFNDAEIILFGGWDHTAINPYPYNNPDKIVSKWFLSYLVEHPMDSYNPYSYDYKVYYAAAHDVGPWNGKNLEESDVTQAIANAKRTQTVKVYSSQSIAAPLLIYAGACPEKRLQLETGGNIDLNGYYVKGKITMNGGEFSNCNAYIDNATGRIGAYSTFDQAYANLESAGNPVVTASNNLVISQNITIPYGVTVSFTSGSNIVCYGSITVEGSLVATGATFNFSGGGFSVGSPGSLTLSNCTINNATIGLSINNRAPSISGCRFVNCGTAVSAANYSNAYLYPNLFSGSSYGINIDAVSSPICGGSSTFRYNTWDIYSSGSQPINAQGNYWGPCPPVPSNYGNINISNYMCSDPWPNVKTPEIPGAVEDIFLSVKSISKSRTSVETDVESYKFAQLLFINGKYDEAIAESEYLIGKFTDSELAKSAIVLIEMCLQKNNADSLITKKLDEIGGKYRTNKLTEFVEYRKAYRSVDKGDFTEAVESFKKILKGSTDSTIIKNSLYQIGNLTYCYTEDKITGNEYFGRLLREYPYDQLSTIAGIKLGRSDKKIEDKSTASKDESSNISMQNYPNPFNPVTTIEYRLNKSGLVCMKVFDVLGREVKTLVNETKEKGVYKVIFDGKNHSSGNYFYRLEFTPSEGKKEILQKSMQIVK